MNNDGMTEEEARIAVANHQKNFSKEMCIEKYGEKDGIEIWSKRQEKWQNTLNNKSDEEKIIIKLKKNNFSVEGVMLRGYSLSDANRIVDENKKKLQRGFKSSFSKEATKFIENYISIDQNENCYYKENEWFIYSQKHKKHFFYDFTNTEKKVIFEYHGEVFHPNFGVMNEEEISNWRQLFTNKDAYEAHKFDMMKREVAEEDGFQIFEIYSNDTEERKKNVLEKINSLLK